MKITEISIADITPYERNPRNIEQSIPLVAESIKEFGFKNPIIIDKEHVIICGHSRFYAAKELGMDKVPCIVSDLPAEKAMAFRIADNKTSELATWDFEKLEQELEKAGDIDMEEKFGFIANMTGEEDDFFSEKHSEQTEKEPDYKECPFCGHLNQVP